MHLIDAALHKTHGARFHEASSNKTPFTREKTARLIKWNTNL